MRTVTDSTVTDSTVTGKTRSAAERHRAVSPVPQRDSAGPVGQSFDTVGNQYMLAADLPQWCVRRSVDGSCAGGCCGGGCQGTEEQTDGIQADLEVGAADDPHEVEADRIADQVVRRDEDSSAPTEDEPGENPFIGQIEQALAQDGVSRSASGLAPASTRGVAAALSGTHGGGSPLPVGVRARMEGAFGTHFGEVRVHTDDRAAEMSRQLRAHAFTRGEDIYFGAGKFDPDSRDGKHLLAHELTHTLQQRDGRPQPIRRLALTRNSRTALTCGGREVRWTFTLGGAAPTDGYIVQHVRSLETIEACPSKVSSIALAPVAEFWEAWKVRAGDTREQLHSSFGYTDSSARPPQVGKSGCQASLGTVKYFPVATTGDLGSDGVAPATPNGGWGPGAAPLSASLPSTTAKPSWWSGTPGEGPANRWASSWWNCCDPVSDQFSIVDSNP